MRNKVLMLLGWFVLTCLLGCRDEEAVNPVEQKPTIGKVIPVILPMEDGLREHWKRTFELFASNLELAFTAQDEQVELTFEYYDENTADLEQLAADIAARKDVYAVIGGLYSDHAHTLASRLCFQDITLFTLATTEELVRAYASSGNLWAMTETDITQCEVLLSKVVNYGGRSVALIAEADAPYGKTFVDWFAFQAEELGLEVKGLCLYEEGKVGDAAEEAAALNADYVICAPSRIDAIADILATFRRVSDTSHLLFSDIGYGANVLRQLGSLAEGMEGVAFGTDPQTGFDVSYRTYYGVDATVGTAQAYDAAMLLAYAAWYQRLYPESTLRDALRNIVNGRDFNMGSWMGEDMRNVVNALADGGHPYVRGVSGPLDFDSKVYTNVLSTVYYHYEVHNGRYIILDYNTSDGGNRTDATLAGWNRKITQMQEFKNEGLDITYAPLTARKALLVASSATWRNYRHQADVLAVYQLLKRHGYTDDDIVLVMADDIAHNAVNPEPGVVRVKPTGENLYRDVMIDYHTDELTPADICNILAGTETERTPIVLDGDEGTNVFVFWSGHGMSNTLCWEGDREGVSREQIDLALTQRYTDQSYRKLAVFVETCFSGSVFSYCAGFPGMLFFTAANPNETSKADVYNMNLGVWMSNRFSATFIECISENKGIIMRNLYNRMFINTIGSHVMVYNHALYGNLHHETMNEFF